MTVSHDVRFAFRTLRMNPGYALAALLTLMLGIGADDRYGARADRGAPLTRVLRNLLYETRATDPLTSATVVLVLAGAAWVASFFPARRRTRVSPMETMRAE
jgi:hypothetical protein